MIATRTGRRPDLHPRSSTTRKSRTTDAKSRRTARHEAGHVVACLFTGTKFKSVTIVPSLAGREREYLGCVDGMPSVGRCRSVSQLENRAMILLAGHLATSRGRRTSWEHLRSSVRDLGQAHECSRRIRERDRFHCHGLLYPAVQEFAVNSYAQTELHIEYLQSRVMAHLDIGWWPIVDAIEEALIRRKTLSYAECIRIAATVGGSVRPPTHEKTLRRIDAAYLRCWMSGLYGQRR